MFTRSASFSRTFLTGVGTLIFSGICLLGATAPAQAKEAAANAPRSVLVHTADLDMTSNAGRKTFQNRVRTAARHVCTGATDDLRGKHETAICLKAAVDSAQPARFAAIK